MLRNNFLILSLVILTGCAALQPGIKTVTVKEEVPVAIPCKAEIPTPPSYNFDKLKYTDDLYTKVQSIMADRLLSLGYQDQLLSALKSCE